MTSPIKHTPGPWWCAGDMQGEKQPLYPVVRAFIDGTERISICRVGQMNTYNAGRNHRDFQNARLISAAPELLSALEELLTFSEIVVEMLALEQKKGSPIQKARAAIEKATRGAA